MAMKIWPKLISGSQQAAGFATAGVPTGAVIGLTVGLYRTLLERVEWTTRLAIPRIGQFSWVIPLWLTALVLTGWLLGRLVGVYSALNGSGIPHLKACLSGKSTMNWQVIIPARFVGGILSAAGGLAAGRVGPAAQIGAAVTQALTPSKCSFPNAALLVGGAAAGLAAALNAPLAGIAFAGEEFRLRPSLFSFHCLSTIFTANAVSRLLFGRGPLFPLSLPQPLSLSQLPVLSGLGLLVGLAGIGFNYAVNRTLDTYAHQSWLPQPSRPVLALLFAGLLGVYLPDAFGSGTFILANCLNRPYPLALLPLLLTARLILTLLSYGSGAPGGLFVPILAIGAILGNLYSQIHGSFAAFQSDPGLLAAVAAAGLFAAVFRAPVTACLLAVELTGIPALLMPAAVVILPAYWMTVRLHTKSLNTLLLGRYLNQGERVRETTETDT